MLSQVFHSCETHPKVEMSPLFHGSVTQLYGLGSVNEPIWMGKSILQMFRTSCSSRIRKLSNSYQLTYLFLLTVIPLRKKTIFDLKSLKGLNTYMHCVSLCLYVYYKSKHLLTWNICEDNMPFLTLCCQRDRRKKDLYTKKCKHS